MQKWKEEEGAVEAFIRKVDAMIETLGQHFGIKQNELGKAQIVLRLNECVRNKKLKKNSPLFLVKEAMSSTQDLMTVEGDSPRLVMFTMEGAIAAAYVVADEIRMKIVEPTRSQMNVPYKEINDWVRCKQEGVPRRERTRYSIKPIVDAHQSLFVKERPEHEERMPRGQGSLPCEHLQRIRKHLCLHSPDLECFCDVAVVSEESSTPRLR
ncbi:uncharacterized protein LOC116853616 [Odontomachus brunneus]|uniref:uncharacterized protein LOC116853616 n=1 Tax=Odontomachus brunneus TaxID=486640 RepID=UPI0013F28FAC|nr:uncharacterized protein LOC116853616 [Odontomachus brunneus]